MTKIPLKCHCGAVRGYAEVPSPGFGVRAVCCCDDCQAFARFLKGEETILDEYGGTDIYAMPLANIKITEGNSRIACMRLTPKGLFRWYTACCNTPIGNTISAAIPYIGVIHNFMDDQGKRDQNLGPILSYINIKFAKRRIPPDKPHPKYPIRVMIKSLTKVLIWRLKGLNRPSPFFAKDGRPVVKPYIISYSQKK